MQFICSLSTAIRHASGLRCLVSCSCLTACYNCHSGRTFTSVFEVFCATAAEEGGRYIDSLAISVVYNIDFRSETRSHVSNEKQRFECRKRKEQHPVEKQKDADDHIISLYRGMFTNLDQIKLCFSR